MLRSFEELAAGRRPVHLAIGMFDGVHLGHQAVVDSALHAARGGGGVGAVLTFDPHPSAVLRPEHPVPQIFPPEVKCSRLHALGVDAVVVQRFDAAFAALAAERFLPWLQQRLPRLRAVYVGDNWRYGQGRAGDVASLLSQARALGLSVVSVPRISRDGEPISSTRIRSLLSSGAVGEAGALLGGGYVSEGRVRAGERLGRQLGFPTLNLDWSPGLRPPYGVYAVRLRSPQRETSASGVANYGIRPTVARDAQALPLLETHVLGDCPWAEGDPIEVEWCHYLRAEQPFARLEDLRSQIVRDVEAARAWHAQAGNG